MNLAPKSAPPATMARFDAPVSEEHPSAPTLESAREQLLQRSRRIVDAAYELVEEDGLDGLTIRAVLKKTGLSRRAFYERFSGKDDVVLAVFEQTIKLAATHYSQQVAALPDPIERLKLIVTCVVLGKSTPQQADSEQISHRGAAMSREHLRLAESRPDDLQAALSPLITLIAQQLADGMKAGLVRNYAPQKLAVLVYNLVSTTVHTELLANETVKPDRARRAQLATDIWEFCRRAITA
jgi:AcrR family transcriptional regulator